MDAVISKLAEQLGVAVPLLWGALVRQAPINSVVSLIQYALVAVFCFAVYKYWKIIYNRVKEDHWDEISYAGPSVATVAAAILCAAVFFDLPDMISGFVNPEYWALHKLLLLK